MAFVFEESRWGKQTSAGNNRFYESNSSCQNSNALGPGYYKSDIESYKKLSQCSSKGKNLGGLIMPTQNGNQWKQNSRDYDSPKVGLQDGGDDKKNKKASVSKMGQSNSRKRKVIKGSSLSISASPSMPSKFMEKEIHMNNSNILNRKKGIAVNQTQENPNKLPKSSSSSQFPSSRCPAYPQQHQSSETSSWRTANLDNKYGQSAFKNAGTVGAKVVANCGIGRNNADIGSDWEQSQRSHNYKGSKGKVHHQKQKELTEEQQQQMMMGMIKTSRIEKNSQNEQNDGREGFMPGLYVAENIEDTEVEGEADGDGEEVGMGPSLTGQDSDELHNKNRAMFGQKVFLEITNTAESDPTKRQFENSLIKTSFSKTKAPIHSMVDPNFMALGGSLQKKAYHKSRNIFSDKKFRLTGKGKSNLSDLLTVNQGTKESTNSKEQLTHQLARRQMPDGRENVEKIKVDLKKNNNGEKMCLDVDQLNKQRKENLKNFLGVGNSRENLLKQQRQKQNYFSVKDLSTACYKLQGKDNYVQSDQKGRSNSLCDEQCKENHAGKSEKVDFLIASQNCQFKKVNAKNYESGISTCDKKVEEKMKTQNRGQLAFQLNNSYNQVNQGENRKVQEMNRGTLVDSGEFYEAEIHRSTAEQQQIGQYTFSEEDSVEYVTESTPGPGEYNLRKQLFCEESHCSMFSANSLKTAACSTVQKFGVTEERFKQYKNSNTLGPSGVNKNTGFFDPKMPLWKKSSKANQEKVAFGGGRTDIPNNQKRPKSSYLHGRGHKQSQCVEKRRNNLRVQHKSQATKTRFFDDNQSIENKCYKNLLDSQKKPGTFMSKCERFSSQFHKKSYQQQFLSAYEYYTSCSALASPKMASRPQTCHTSAALPQDLSSNQKVTLPNSIFMSRVQRCNGQKVHCQTQKVDFGGQDYYTIDKKLSKSKEVNQTYEIERPGFGTMAERFDHYNGKDQKADKNSPNKPQESVWARSKREVYPKDKPIAYTFGKNEKDRQMTSAQADRQTPGPCQYSSNRNHWIKPSHHIKYKF